MIVAIVSLKGGVGKTTTAMHLAAYAAHSGHNVVVVDADDERSALSWAAMGDLPFQVVPADRDALARQVRELATVSTVIVDTPPNNREILHRASTLADTVVVPLKPTGLDVNRLKPTLELLRDVEATRGSLDVAILFTHWDGRRILAREALDVLEDFPLLNARIRYLARYEQAFGVEPPYLLEYGQAWEEIVDAQA